MTYATNASAPEARSTVRTGRRGTSPSSNHSNVIDESVASPKAASDRYFTGKRKLLTKGTIA